MVLMQTEKAIAQKKLLNISHERTCDCGATHINCLSAKEWIKSQLGVWEFGYEERDIRDKTVHPATFPISLATKVISLFSHKGELVVDPFVGSGTVLIAARDLGRNAVGFDLNQKYIEVCNRRLSQQHLEAKTKQIAVCDDARNMPQYFEENSISCLLTSPPYANLLNRQRKNKSRRGVERHNSQYLKVEQYSQDPRDLGTMDINTFSEALSEIYKSVLPCLKPKGHCVINVADMWWENHRVPIHIYVVEAMENAGYELRNTIIWNRLNIVNNIGIIGWPSNYITMGTTFEYILDFWKPPKL
ncbi:MAG: DNA methyltransferase [Planctomycetota bacterium]|nr:DNA methyltransferase [Planctomycetota bacterium]